MTRRFCAIVRVLINRSMSKTNEIGCTISQENEGYTDEKLISPAASRNKDPILQVLKRFIISDTDQIEDESPLFLEISSGTGQHVSHFAPHFPGVKFQPSEVDKTLFKSISYYASSCPTNNIIQPIFIDIQNKLSYYGFEEGSVDYMFNANMIHISPFECTIGLFENAGVYLKPEALMITYGPYSKDGIITPQSNISFHASLRSRNPLWGIRDINDLIKLGDENNLSLIDTVEMPANNMTLIWKKD
ncbi:methyltransferase-like 26 [Pararge aegeria]|uniref:Methyltransferase-like 26 n=1 Tax=Pararge aegeria TaxID=116150 RepID=S4PCZ9_9NEOP|nr:methyltransferase-like 26 [Pararge aegeria]XP_039760745.1 methyltransferase-like 26 [Pararge aegeria]XP_039760754.1 methyltransferase-like 26 [Pararge aegeria]